MMESQEELRTGVFICRCGTNIGGVVDVPQIVEYARTLKSVAFVDEGKWICSVDYLAKIRENIAQHKLNRIVVACCTPRTHEPIFKSTLKEAGLNPFLLEFVSIREQCSWVHRTNPEAATEKAKALVRMGLEKAILLEPGEEIRLAVGKDALVIGGGIAGMTAAATLANHGFNVRLVEKTSALGGILNNLSHVAPSNISADDIVSVKQAEIAGLENIKIHLNTIVDDVKGYIGNYEVNLCVNGSREVVKASTIIVATGMREIEPLGQFGYGEYPNVVTLLTTERMLKDKKLKGLRDFVIINCVGSRNETRGCCHVGCLASIKTARLIKEQNEDTRVYLLYRDLSLYGEQGRYLEETIDRYDIKLIRYPDGKPPQVNRKPQKMKTRDGLTVRVYDVLLGRELDIPADLLILTTAFRGDSTVDKLKGFLKVSTDPDDFFQEAHIKLRPLDFAAEGVYTCGCARSPKPMRDSIEEAIGAAMRAAIPMKRGYVESEGIVADISLDKCSRCGLCHKNCPFGAIELVEKAPHVIKAICKGCGICAANCPEEAIEVIHFKNEQILAQIDAALAQNPAEKIIAFCCHWCAHGAVDIAGVSRLEYPTNIHIIRVMCSGRVSTTFIERGFEKGAAGVLVAGCEFPTCHYIDGNYRCKENMERVKKKLLKKGFDADRLWTVWLSAADGPKFAKTVKEMASRVLAATP